MARRRQHLEDLSEELSSEHQVQALPVSLDLSDADFMQTLVDAVGDREVGMLINNAGCGSTGVFSENDPVKEADMVRVNCWAPTVLTHHFVPPMVRRGRGAVIFLGSVVGYQATPYMTTYSATKAFNVFMGEGLWFELKRFNIDVLSLAPGSTNTEFHGVANMTLGPLFATPEQVVQTAMKALGRRPCVVVGRLNKALAKEYRVLPRRLLVALAGQIISRFHYRKVD